MKFVTHMKSMYRAISHGTNMSVTLAKVRVYDEDTFHRTGETKIVYMYVNHEGLQISDAFNTVNDARLWYSDMMKDYPYNK